MAIKIEIENKMKACPFCGATAQLVKGSIYNGDAYKVECPRCHASTSRVHIGTYLMYRGKTDVSFTDEQARQQAVDCWNSRTTPTKNSI